MPRKLEILLLCDRRSDAAPAAADHIDGITSCSRHNIRWLSIFGNLPAALDLDRFDGVIIHYSLTADPDRLLPPAVCSKITGSKALKAVFVQDEHRNVAKRIELLRRLGTEILFTCVPTSEIDKVYPETALSGVQKINVLTGYVPSALVAMDVPRFQDRPIDVGYRARELPAWLGKLAWEKAEIGRRFLRNVGEYGLRADISVSEHDRIYGPAWISFLARCKATLGSESGASVFDLDGSIEASVRDYCAKHPRSSFERIRSNCFSALDGVIDNAQVSPRIFEAAALRTLMILYPGRYSGVVQPWRHYVPLERDHSNMAEVIAVLRDPIRAEKIIQRAYLEVAQNTEFHFSAMTALMDNAFEKHATHAARPYSDLEWDNVGAIDPVSRIRRRVRALRDRAVSLAYRTVAKATSRAFADRCKHLLSRFRTS